MKGASHGRQSLLLAPAARAVDATPKGSSCVLLDLANLARFSEALVRYADCRGKDPRILVTKEWKHEI